MSSPTPTDGDEKEEKEEVEEIEEIEEEEEEEEEVEFVSEVQQAPVIMDSVDLLSDSEEEECFPKLETVAEKSKRQREEANAALAKLAVRVEREKLERAERLKDFKERQNSQMARARQFLSTVSSESQEEARQCIQMWVNRPDPTRRRRTTTPSFSPNSSTRYPCPVENCGQVFDNPLLLGGHLKRFDHSPCDPAVNLKGSSVKIFACVACGQHFQTKNDWSTHRDSKLSLPNTEGHTSAQMHQLIVCYACPCCYLLFNLPGECLQHMSSKNHFTESLKLTASKGTPVPVPIPQYVKDRLVSLCRGVPYNVQCGKCHAVLKSHQAAMAHFNVKCRSGSFLLARADKSVMEVMKQLQVWGQCVSCSKLFLSQALVQEHKESSQHDVEVNKSMARALLQHGRFGETQNVNSSDDILGKKLSIDLWIPREKRIIKSENSEEILEEIPSKRRRHSPGSLVSLVCECGEGFSEEAQALKHLIVSNHLFHQCGMCGKQMVEPSITRLHMCRFHGITYLSNFFYYCSKCGVVMPEVEHVRAHVSEHHSGHTFISEKEASEVQAKPSTSYEGAGSTAGPSKAAPSWMCRMCEDIFDSEHAARKHCGRIGNHSFQKFICGHCSQKFFKESTLQRHCESEHDGQVRGGFFCGLCDSMQFDSHTEFLEHYDSLHSNDYYCLDDNVVPPNTPPSCSCTDPNKSKKELKLIKTQCMKDLASEGKCQYVCAPCSVTVHSYGKIKTHVAMKHPPLDLDMSFGVLCTTCPETFPDVQSFHTHHHATHCTLEPCPSSRTRTESAVDEMKTRTILDEDEAENPKTAEDDAGSNELDEEVKKALALSLEEESPEMKEALQRSMLDF